MTSEAVCSVRFLDIEFSQVSAEQAVEWVDRRSREDHFSYVVTPNVDHLVMYHGKGGEAWREAYRKAVGSSDLCLNDSRILAALAALSHKPLEITPGSDLVRDLIERLGERTTSLVLIGGKESEAEWLRRALPNATVRHFDPPMGVRDDPQAQAAIASFVETEHADIALFAIGAPQSEIVARQIAERGKARGVGLCIGASVEFLSGAKRRAPRAMQRLGLEWLFRLASEPSRLWRRYLVRGPVIFAIWWRARSQ